MTRLTALLVAVVLTVGCGQKESETGAMPPTTPVVFNVANAPTVEFSVPDMMCESSCAVKTRQILSEQPGVKEVVVDFPARTATVAIDPDKFDADVAIAELVDYGFDHSAVKQPTP